MKVAIYSGTFQKDQDGVAKTLYELVRTMRGEGIEVEVWSPLITSSDDQGIKVHKVGSIAFPLYKDYRFAITTPKTFKQVKEFGPDVIHIASPEYGGWRFLKFARRGGYPILATYHTDFPSYLKYYHLGFLKKAMWRSIRSFYNRCDMVYAPTKEVARELESHGIREVNIWSRGIHREIYHPRFRSEELRRKWGAKDKKVILFSGRFVWYKGLDVFVDVYKKFKKKRRADVVFVMLGDGPIKDELMKSMPDAIFKGYLKGDELSSIYASADILLFPSVTETFGNVVLEAISSGVPAVVSNVGGCKEIVKESEGGLISDANDVESFYENCLRLVNDRELYEKIRIKGLIHSENRTWKHINMEIIRGYQRIVEKGLE